jgi:8-oxo-dGTP diphosphatase
VCHHVRVAARRRVAAVIVRRGRRLMVRERGRGPAGRHDGPEYWTLPGGGVAPGVTPPAALTWEVREEVGLTRHAARYPFDIPYPSGRTACYAVAVAEDALPRRRGDGAG